MPGAHLTRAGSPPRGAGISVVAHHDGADRSPRVDLARGRDREVHAAVRAGVAEGGAPRRAVEGVAAVGLHIAFIKFRII